jgi:hypothetical protein
MISMRCGLILAVLTSSGWTQTLFRPALEGCAMAHCNSAMSDYQGMQALRAHDVSVQAHDWLSGGSDKGLGCSSNGRVAVCSYKSNRDSVIAYSPQGLRLWASRDLLTLNSFTSAPMIDSDGSVIAADDTHLIRFSPRGDVVWKTTTTGGYPVSPMQTASGVILLATALGPVSIYDSRTGALLGSRYLYQEGGTGNFFETLNTPCAIGNRVYVSTQLNEASSKIGRLYAIDVDTTDEVTPLKVAWFWEFQAPSGASPTCLGNTVYFDGAGLTPRGPALPVLMAVEDRGERPAMRWHQIVASNIPASVAHDPRGGIWVICADYSKIRRYSSLTGTTIETYDVGDFFKGGGKYVPSSAMTISGDRERPVMTVGIIGADSGQNYVTAVDLTTRSVLWKQNISLLYNDHTAGQFPTVLDRRGRSVVVFSGWNTGAFFVGRD